ncbi:MAG: hypothetical protein RQ826_17740 [Xanthomonadales bacterium]|nr:hypothetical protein [Xanthomonadales bacterium]
MMMTETRDSAVKGRSWLRMLAQVSGFAVFAAYLALGTLVLLGLLIGGLWEGFGRQSYVLMFLAAVVYVYGTAWLAFSFGMRPGRVRGVLLAVLVIPVVISLIPSAHEGMALKEAARVYVADEEPAAVSEARERLLSQGRRAGRHGYIDILLEELDAAESDAQRVRLVVMLGELSYQYEPVLERLRAIYRDSQDDPERRALYHAVVEAIRGVNPYEQGLPEENRENRGSGRVSCIGRDTGPSDDLRTENLPGSNALFLLQQPSIAIAWSIRPLPPRNRRYRMDFLADPPIMQLQHRNISAGTLFKSQSFSSAQRVLFLASPVEPGHPSLSPFAAPGGLHRATVTHILCS